MICEPLRGEQQGCESLALSRTGKAQELGEKPDKAWEARGTRSRIAPCQRLIF